MPHYFKDQTPKAPTLADLQWHSASAMNAHVILTENGSNKAYTNLDEISGKVVVKCAKSAEVSAIVVKLEGESRTRLAAPARVEGERPRPVLEYHKVLYRTLTVFPPPELVSGGGTGKKSSFALPPGQHEYPFSFKLPFNNSCADDRNPMPSVSRSGTGFEIARPAPRHVKKTLPPTLSGFPGEAEIRYFVKCTVTRHSIFKENPRAYTPFNFFPIEPPRPESTGSEVYARQKHAFSLYPAEAEKGKSKMKSFFISKERSESGAPVAEAPYVSVDIRLPEPAILTCNKEIPLRIVVKKLNSNNETVYLQSLQVQLVGHTRIRAHEVFRTESSSWIIMSKSNMGIPVGLPTDPVDSETVIDDRLWKGQPLPNTIAPSFETCNIGRSYQLDVRVGLRYSGSTVAGAKVGRGSIPRVAQDVTLPLRLDLVVYSGITPPPELLEAMARSKGGDSKSATTPQLRTQPGLNTAAVTEKLRTEGRMDSDFGRNQVPPTPVDDAGPSTNAAPSVPPRPGELPVYSDAPPSYEDAIATHLPPVSAPRPEYAPPAAGEDHVLGSEDEKKGWLD